MTDQTARRVPRIRFKGFGAEWEKKKLGEIYAERNERGNDSLPILSVSIHSGVSNGELSSETLGKKVRRSEDKSLYKHVYAGDLVLNMMRAWQGAFGVVKIEGMASPAYLTAIPNNTIYPPFMDCGLRRPQIVAQMNNLSYGVTDFRKRLYWDSFVRIEFDIPSVPEQQKVAAYFTHLDSAISLHQRKHDKLLALKKAMLQQMFTKPGANKPDVRFGGFEGDWVQKEFKEIAFRSSSTRAEAGLPRIEYEDIVSGVGQLNKDVFKKSSLKAGLFFEKGDVLFGKLRPYLKNWLMADFSGIAVGDFWVLKPIDSDSGFIYYLIQTQEFESVANKSAGSKMPRSDWKLVSGSEFRIPVRIEEQRKIGAYFHTFDALIAQQATQLQKLQQIKSACLEKMFV